MDSLAVGVKSQVTNMNYRVGNYASPHQHPHEQSGYVISGRFVKQQIDTTLAERRFELSAKQKQIEKDERR